MKPCRNRLDELIFGGCMKSYGASVGWAVLLGIMLLPLNAASESLDNAIEEIANGLAFSRSGQVLKVSKSEVYINIGQEQGIQKGSDFEIVELGEPITTGNEIIGYEETLIAKARAERVREKMSICKITAMVRPPAEGNKAYQVRKKILRLAVSQFPYNQQSNQLTGHLQQKLSTALTQKGMQVVERGQLEKVLQEQKLGYSGLVNLDSAKKVGQLLGAEAIILGSIGDLGDNLTVDARLVDLESGDSMAAVDSTMTKTQQVAQMLEKNNETYSSGGISASPADGKKNKGAYPSHRDESLLVEIIGFMKDEENNLTLELKLTNKTGETRRFGFRENTYLRDENLDEYWIGKREEIELQPNISRKITLSFRNSKQTIGSVFTFSTDMWGGSNRLPGSFSIQDIRMENS